MINLKTENTIDRLFVLAIEVEYKTAGIYERFSKLFQHVPGLSAFWKELHDDEIQHATTLQNVRKSLTPEQLLVHPAIEIWESVMNVRQIVNKDVFGSINSLNDAYELAHELEFFEANTIFNFLTSKFIPSGKPEKFDYLAIVKHQQKLMDFSHSFGNREWRKDIKVQDI
jgi:rubrerythrin